MDTNPYRSDQSGKIDQSPRRSSEFTHLVIGSVIVLPVLLAASAHLFYHAVVLGENPSNAPLGFLYIGFAVVIGLPVLSGWVRYLGSAKERVENSERGPAKVEHR